MLGLVSASNEHERRAATALLFGGLGQRMDVLRDGLEELRALCEASLDFDESDTGHVPVDELERLAEQARERIDEALRFEERRDPRPGRVRVVLAGRANAGKSSLFNRLVGGDRLQDAALVSDLPGTTRDVKAADWEAEGVACELVDTAGLERSEKALEQAAEVRARHAAQTADVLVWVVDGASTRGASELAEALEARRLAGGLAVLCWNKSDDPRAAAQPPRALRRAFDAHVVTSAATGAGCEQLAAAVAATLREGVGVGRELAARHRSALEAAGAALDEARTGLRSGAPLDAVAEILRVATFELDGISGSTTPEDLLDRIFARFCLGK